MFIKNHSIRNTGRTHWKAGHTPWNKDKNISLKPLTGWEITCIVCGSSKYYQLNEHKKRKRVYCSLACYHKHSRKQTLSYSGIHSRMIRDFGKASKCIICGSTQNVDWANISGKYLLDRGDWAGLCRKHHIAFDNGKITLLAKK